MIFLWVLFKCVPLVFVFCCLFILELLLDTEDLETLLSLYRKYVQTFPQPLIRFFVRLSSLILDLLIKHHIGSWIVDLYMTAPPPLFLLNSRGQYIEQFNFQEPHF